MAAFSLTYPATGVSFFGWPMPWWVTFLILSLVFAFALCKPRGVSI